MSEISVASQPGRLARGESCLLFEHDLDAAILLVAEGPVGFRRLLQPQVVSNSAEPPAAIIGMSLMCI